MSLRLLCEPTPEMKQLAHDFDANIAVMLAAVRSDLQIKVTLQREGDQLRVIALFLDRDVYIDGLRADFDALSPAVATAIARAVAQRFAALDR